MAIRVLFADDQIPHDDPSKDQAVKEEICKEFEVHRGWSRADTMLAFEDDFKFFKNLLAYLQSEKGVLVIPARTFKEARGALKRYNSAGGSENETIDVAIIDLSWWGDRALPSGKEGRHNKGYALLDCARTRSRVDGVFIPTIAYSQNFYDVPATMGEVLKRGALPIPKISRKNDDEQKRIMGYEALFSAIEHLTTLTPANQQEIRDRALFEREFKKRSNLLLWLMIGTFVLLIVSLLMPSLAPEAYSNQSYDTLIKVLLGTGALGLLGLALKNVQRTRADLGLSLGVDTGDQRSRGTQSTGRP